MPGPEPRAASRARPSRPSRENSETGLGGNLQERRWQELLGDRAGKGPQKPERLRDPAGIPPLAAARWGFIIRTNVSDPVYYCSPINLHEAAKPRAGRGERSAERAKSPEKALAQKGARGGEAGSAFGERGSRQGRSPSQRCGSPAPGHWRGRKSGTLPLPPGGCTAALPGAQRACPAPGALPGANPFRAALPRVGGGVGRAGGAPAPRGLTRALLQRRPRECAHCQSRACGKSGNSGMVWGGKISQIPALP